MKRLFVSLAFLLLSSVAAMAQMSGGSAGPAQPGMMGGGMMAPGMMPVGMMPGGMMGRDQEMMPCMMMGQMMAGMMPSQTKGCLGMAGMMMMGNFDLPRMQMELGLTAEQADKLRAIQKPHQREAIQIGAAIRIAALDVSDLVSADKPDWAKVEGKLKELEALRTRIALAHLKAAEEVKKVISKEQLEKFQEMCRGCSQSGRPVPNPPPDVVPQGGGKPHEGHPQAQ